MAKARHKHPGYGQRPPVSRNPPEIPHPFHLPTILTPPTFYPPIYIYIYIYIQWVQKRGGSKKRRGSNCMGFSSEKGPKKTPKNTKKCQKGQNLEESPVFLPPPKKVTKKTPKMTKKDPKMTKKSEKRSKMTKKGPFKKLYRPPLKRLRNFRGSRHFVHLGQFLATFWWFLGHFWTFLGLFDFWVIFWVIFGSFLDLFHFWGVFDLLGKFWGGSFLDFLRILGGFWGVGKRGGLWP